MGILVDYESPLARRVAGDIWSGLSRAALEGGHVRITAFWESSREIRRIPEHPRIHVFAVGQDRPDAIDAIEAVGDPRAPASMASWSPSPTGRALWPGLSLPGRAAPDRLGRQGRRGGARAPARRPRGVRALRKAAARAPPGSAPDPLMGQILAAFVVTALFAVPLTPSGW